MSVSRKPVSRRLRFEVFKRDGFRCIYCGATPVQRLLHVDHVEPVADGGSDEPANLVTACDSCNLGKGAVPLERRALQAAGVTEEQRDHAEQIREYLAVQREIAQAKSAVVAEIENYWLERLGGISQELASRLPRLVEQWQVSKLLEAIDICARKQFGAYDQDARYFYGILRRWREGRWT